MYFAVPSSPPNTYQEKTRALKSVKRKKETKKIAKIKKSARE
jgi:hypothetical protein